MTDYNSNTVEINWANPKIDEVWRGYIAGKFAVRELNSGRVQIKAGDGDWADIEGVAF